MIIEHWPTAEETLSLELQIAKVQIIPTELVSIGNFASLVNCCLLVPLAISQLPYKYVISSNLRYTLVVVINLSHNMITLVKIVIFGNALGRSFNGKLK